jgi:hypothetical protein
MDPLLLLGAGAVVLVALTLLVVWQAPAESVRSEDTAAMMPQGDTFEDQYTSATADLSAGGVAITNATSVDEAPSTTVQAAQGEPWPEDTVRTEGAATGFEAVRPYTPMRESEPGARRMVSVGAAAALTLAGAAAGAWLYARWQRRRNTPINQLRRRFR